MTEINNEKYWLTRVRCTIIRKLTDSPNSRLAAMGFIMHLYHYGFLFFFFQAEDGIRDDLVTGVQTCALPICESIADVARNLDRWVHGIVARVYSQRVLEEMAANASIPVINALSDKFHPCQEIGRASCRERV